MFAAKLLLFCVFEHCPKALCVGRLPLFVDARRQIDVVLPLLQQSEGAGYRAGDVGYHAPLCKAHQQVVPAVVGEVLQVGEYARVAAHQAVQQRALLAAERVFRQRMRRHVDAHARGCLMLFLEADIARVVQQPQGGVGLQHRQAHRAAQFVHV